MAKKESPKQVNFRLELEHHDVLDAVAYLEERSVADVAREVVQEFLERRASDHDVKTMLQLRAQKRQEATGAVSPLRKSENRRGEVQ